MTRICAFSSKGGAGKTTASVILSHGLHLPLCDLDPRKNATRWLARGELPHVLASPAAESWVADCPPEITGEHIRVLASADLVIVPICASFNDLDALPETVRFVEANTRGRVAFLLSAIDSRTSDEQMLRAVLKQFEHPVLGKFSYRAAYRRAGLDGQLPGDLDPVAREEAGRLVAAVKELA